MASDMRQLRGQAACVGVATFGCGECPGWNSMEMMGKAALLALDDAGVKIGEVDGIWAATAVHSMPAMSLAEHLGVVPKYSSGSNIGGSSRRKLSRAPPPQRSISSPSSRRTGLAARPPSSASSRSHNNSEYR